MKIKILIIVLSLSTVFGQSKRDPRAVAMAGAYTTIADGIFAVGYNPAMLAYQKAKPFQLMAFGTDFGFAGNYISLSNLNALSGDTIQQDQKDQLFRYLDNSGGLAFFTDMHVPLPFLNYSSGNMAITSNMIVMGDFKLPTGLLRLMLEGNANNPSIDMTLKYEVMAVNEFGFSFAIPFDAFALGVTAKYLQGLFYLGVDPDSSKASLETSVLAMYGTGNYLLRQGIGGSGLGMDLGFITSEYNGWRAGLSVINAFGSITWNKPSVMKDILAGSDNIYGNEDDLFHFTWSGETLNDSMAINYTYTIDSISATNLSSDSLFKSESKLVKNLGPDGKLKDFTINYPAMFRVGVSKRTDDYIISSDLVASFEDRFFARQGWKWSIGFEIHRFPAVPLRIGFSWGGSDLLELGLGFGFHKGPIIFDMGFAFRNGLWIHTMKGFNLSTGLTITGLGGRSTGDEALTGPAPPVPEESDSDDLENGDKPEASDALEKEADSKESLPGKEE